MKVIIYAQPLINKKSSLKNPELIICRFFEVLNFIFFHIFLQFFIKIFNSQENDNTFKLQEYEKTHFEGICSKYGIPDIEFFRNFHNFEEWSKGKIKILDAEIENLETLSGSLEQVKVDCK